MEEKYILYDIKNEGLKELLYQLFQQLDYSLQYGDERVAWCEEVLRNQSWLHSYIQTKQFSNRHIKTNNDFLCENDEFSECLSKIADYILFTDFRDEPHQQDVLSGKCNNIKNEYPTLSQHRKSTNKYREALVFENVPESKLALQEHSIQEMLIKRKSEKRQQEDRKVSKKDIEKYAPLQQIMLNIHHLEKQLQATATAATNKQPLNDVKARKMRKLLGELKYEMFIVREKLRGVFSFESSGTSVYVWDEDTGYFDEDHYISVSDNKIDFKKGEHIQGILLHYFELSSKYVGRVDEDLYEILREVEELAAITNLKPKERDVLNILLQQSESYRMNMSYIHHEKTNDILTDDKLNDDEKRCKLMTFTINPKTEIIRRATEHVQQTYSNKANMRQVKRMVQSIADKISKTYCVSHNRYITKRKKGLL